MNQKQNLFIHKRINFRNLGENNGLTAAARQNGTRCGKSLVKSLENIIDKRLLIFP